MNKIELRQLIKEEISKTLGKNTFKSFKEDFDKIIKYAGLSLKDGTIIVYLDNEPNKEKNMINKLVREKYIDSLQKIPSELDIMKFKIIK